jgi:hypothetical protein
MISDNNRIDWNEVSKSNKGVRDSDDVSCGNIVSESGDSIVISEGAVNVHEYVVPKSKVSYYDGYEVHLTIPYITYYQFLK